MNEPCITYFGYGSLVNRATRPPDEQSWPARLYGWKRVWGHRVIGSDAAGTSADNASTGTDEASTGTRQSCCSLSVERLSGNLDAHRSSPSNYIDGVVVTIPLADLPVLDARENGYDRVPVDASAFDLPDACAAETIHVYVSDEQHAGLSNRQHPILQSYVDCVLAGYCSVFGQSGMKHFINSTSGWNGVIENERHAPKYPRHVQLDAQQLESIDAAVNLAVKS